MSKNNAPLSFQFSYKYLQSQLVFIIKNYPMFGLTKVRYYDNSDEFIIDSKLLADKPTNEHTINIRLLGGAST